MHFYEVITSNIQICKIIYVNDQISKSKLTDYTYHGYQRKQTSSSVQIGALSIRGGDIYLHRFPK